MPKRFFSILLGSIFLLSFLRLPAQESGSLLDAIRNNDLGAVKIKLAEKGTNIAEVDADGDNVLMYAALYSSPACLKVLLEKGAAPNATNKLGESPLIWAINDIEKTRLLLEYGASPNMATKSGNTPFLSACVGRKQSGIISLLLDKGADPLAINNNGLTSLMQVALYGDTAVAGRLLNLKVNINAVNKGKETALMLAVKSMNKNMVFWLLRQGADATLQDVYKATALSYAVVLNDASVVEALLAKTVEIDHQDIDGMDYLMWAAYSEHDNPEIMGMLLKSGMKTTLKDKNGETALDWAKKKGRTQTVALLEKVSR